MNYAKTDYYSGALKYFWTRAAISELEQLYRQAKKGVESRQYQIIWLLAQGKKTEEERK